MTRKERLSHVLFAWVRSLGDYFFPSKKTFLTCPNCLNGFHFFDFFKPSNFVFYFENFLTLLSLNFVFFKKTFHVQHGKS